MLFCAFRLGMPWRKYLEEHDLLDHLVWLHWFGMHQFEDMSFKKKDPYECKIGDGPDAHMTQETWDRYRNKIAGAKFALMGRKEGVTFDERS